MSEENTMIEIAPTEPVTIESTQNEVVLPEVPQKPRAFKKKRDIFRFKGSEEMAIDLGHIYKIVINGKRITFYTPFSIPCGDEKKFADYVDFEEEDAAIKVYEAILTAWSADVLE